jgi:hypothetical protein
MLQMIQINRQTLRGIIPLEITHDIWDSTYQPLMTAVLSSLLRYCPLVAYIGLIAPPDDINGKRWAKFRQTTDILRKHNNRLSTLEKIEVHSNPDIDDNVIATLTRDEVNCLLQPQSNRTNYFPPLQCFPLFVLLTTDFALIILFVESLLKALDVGSCPLTNNALNWLSHHQLLTSLTFRLEEGDSKDTEEQWLQKRDLFVMAIRSLPHLHLDVNIIDMFDNEELPPFPLTSSSLTTLDLQLTGRPIFDMPSLTHLDISWFEGDPFNDDQEMMDMFVNCKKVTRLSLHDTIDLKMVIPWHLFAPNMISLNLSGSARLSLPQYHQMLHSPQFATLERFQCRPEHFMSHYLLDAILKHWKHLKRLEVDWLRPIDTALLIAANTEDNNSSISSTLSLITSMSQYSSSSPVGEGKRWVHQSLERLTIHNKHLIKHWIMPSLQHFTFTTHHEGDNIKYDDIEVIWSFLSHSCNRLHTLQFLPSESDAKFNDSDDHDQTLDTEIGRTQLKRITFPNLERLIISDSYLKWLYECIDAGPYLSVIQINDLNTDLCKQLIKSKKPMVNLIISSTTHPNEWHQYQPIHLYLVNPLVSAYSTKELSHVLIAQLLLQFKNINSLQIHSHESVIDRRVIETIRSVMPTRSIHLLFAEESFNYLTFLNDDNAST